ncbi:MAG: hypothetical protein QOI63_1899, partial [Thermoplasmata archaeon]|nr:hypothetical protein [Thermoplasmata archaeon]
MANPLQAFNDSDLGVATATSLHTLGALGFLAGAIGYLAWHRSLRRGADLGGLLRAAAFTTYLSIVANLLGGFLRTYESGHPHLADIARSPWVQVIAAKHLFLFAAMGAAIVLFERTVPRLRRAAAEGRLAQVPVTAHRVGAAFVLAGIAAAALLGSVSQVVAELPAAPVQEPVPREVAHLQTFTGTLAGNPLMPAHGGAAFIVPVNASSLRFQLDVAGSPGLQVSLTEPDGATTHPVGAPAFPGGTSTFVVLLRPAAGAWRFDLS